jgi:hypothetical protein
MTARRASPAPARGSGDARDGPLRAETIIDNPQRKADMKKLSLNLDDLRVESFSTARDGDQEGTVAGYVATEWVCTPYDSCQATFCGASCDGTCGESHARTCGAVTPCGGDSIDACQSDWCPIG